MIIRSAALALLLGASFAHAQSDTDTDTDTGNPMSELMSGVTATANNLSATVDTLSERIVASSNSREEGTRMLDEMLAAARDVNGSLDRDSEIWTELNDLIKEWTATRDGLRERISENPNLEPVMDLWATRIEDANRLRTQILDQSATSQGLVEQIENQREVVLAYYEVGAADAVLAAMQEMSDDLGEMNSQMGEILSQAGVVTQSEAAGQ